jgi:predicted nucleic acid-binding protein
MSEVFVDTSAIYALLVSEDAKHSAARTYLQGIDEKDFELVTSSFARGTREYRNTGIQEYRNTEFGFRKAKRRTENPEPRNL